MGLHGGHRQRMYNKLKKNAMEEHEWLEMLLYRSTPRCNTNDLAHRLVLRFGSALDVLKAPLEELLTVEGVGIQIAAHLKCIEHFYKDYTRDTSKEFGEKYTVEGFAAYLKRYYEEEPYEIMDIYLFDKGGYLLKRESFTTEEVSRVEVRPEIVSRILLAEGANAIVVVHNHPGGTKAPSDVDDEMTKMMQILCSTHNLTFCDHMIYTKEGVYSYYASGRMAKLSYDYSVNTLVRKED